MQIHADIDYVRTGTSATRKEGQFTFHLKASLDQLMVRIKPNEGDLWPDYAILDEYPRVGKLSGNVTLTAEANYEDVSASANASTALSSLDQLWIEDIKAMPFIFPGIGAEIRVEAFMKGSARSNLPTLGGPPEGAVFVWPTPVNFDAAKGSFVSEGSLRVYPNFGPRPADPSMAGIYDLLKGSTDEALPGIGGLTAPAVGAVLNGTPDNWTLSLDREAKPDLPTGGEYSHRVKITLKLVPTTLPIPKAKPEPAE